MRYFTHTSKDDLGSSVDVADSFPLFYYIVLHSSDIDRQRAVSCSVVVVTTQPALCSPGQSSLSQFRSDSEFLTNFLIDKISEGILHEEDI